MYCVALSSFLWEVLAFGRTLPDGPASPHTIAVHHGPRTERTPARAGALLSFVIQLLFWQLMLRYALMPCYLSDRSSETISRKGCKEADKAQSILPEAVVVVLPVRTVCPRIQPYVIPVADTPNKCGRVRHPQARCCRVGDGGVFGGTCAGGMGSRQTDAVRDS